MSRNKGANYERKVAKSLSDWWGGRFSRVPASGGLRWGDDHRVAGDIIPPPEADFPFVVECKHQESWTIEHIFLDIGKPREWWKQVVMDGRRVNRTPILFFTRNRAKDFVMLPYEQGLYTKLRENSNELFITDVSIENIRGEIQYFTVMVTTFDAFIEVPKETIRKYGKEVEWDIYKEEYE